MLLAPELAKAALIFQRRLHTIMANLLRGGDAKPRVFSLIVSLSGEDGLVAEGDRRTHDLWSV